MWRQDAGSPRSPMSQVTWWAVSGERSPEVPLHVVVAQVGAGQALLRVDEVGELDAVADEEDGGVVAHEVVVALVGVELEREAARVAPGVGAPLLAGHGGEAGQHLDLGARLEQRRASVGTHVARGGERAEGAAALGVDDALRNLLAVELRELLDQVVVVQRDRTAVPDALRVGVARDRLAGVRGGEGGFGHGSPRG